MGYYLEKAPDNKDQFKTLGFNAAQLNFCMSMMLQCTKLRQRQPIINLMRESLPEDFDLKLVTKQGYKGDYDAPFIEQKVIA